MVYDSDLELININDSSDTYHIFGWARGDAVTAPQVHIGSTVVWDGTELTSWQRFDLYVDHGMSQGGALKLAASGASEP